VIDFKEHAERIARDGYTILAAAIAPDLCRELRCDLERIERERGIVPAKNSFEGHHTVRIYNLLAEGKIYEGIPVHSNVLPVVERVLDPGCLVSSLSSISIDPGERAQPIHADDQLIPIAKPHVPTVCNTMWALTDFTEENGATRIIPGSHLRDHSPEYLKHYDSIPAEMPTGSVLVWHGSLWHGGGANRSSARRNRDELLRRLRPAAGEPAARHSPRDRARLLAASSRARRLRRVQRAHRTHRQAKPGAAPRRVLSGHRHGLGRRRRGRRLAAVKGAR
jgi:ectoine hydroxylase-related dioxygenase (phytanoyl-CoA dioxygenase family)